MIANFVGDYHKDWDKYISLFAYSLRTAVHDSTGNTPAQLFLGHKLITHFEQMMFTEQHLSERHQVEMERLILHAQEALRQA